MKNEKKEVLLEEAKTMKGIAKNINTILLPKLRKFKDAFTPSEWDVIELAVDNYIIDMTSEATRLKVTAQQDLS
jgi:hypothetical protein